MRPELWPRVREVFELSLATADVEALLERECGDDAELREAVLALRASDAAAESLEPPSLAARRGAALPIELAPGERVGAFVVRGEMERGGMGVVYEAEQLEPRRLVALKVLPAGREGQALTQHVESEAEILAGLQHPGIAAVYAAGVHTLADGRELPYLAMELVEGARGFLAYADDEQLDLASRLRLFGDACNAVHAAHQKGVIHHDLKPSNLLVDRDGRVRVIDFGIAHIARRGQDVDSTPRDDHTVLGTPGYVSPERMRGDDAGHDVRTDVYSLGVVLAQLCGTAPTREVEWIVERARSPAAEQRYASAADLAGDVARFLAREPVLAGPTTAGYRARCFVRRHAAGVAAAVTVVVLLVAGLVGTTLGWREAERQEGTAREQARRSGALRDVLRSLIVEASTQRQGRNVKLLHALDNIVADIEPAFEGQFDLQVVALCDVAHVQIDIGEWQRARGLLLRAVTIAERHLPQSRELAEALNLLGLAHQYLLESSEAIATYRRAGAIASELDEDSGQLQRSIEQNLTAELGRIGELPRAILELEETYRSNAVTYGEDDPRTLVSGNLLAENYRKIRRLDDALALSERLLAFWRARGKPSAQSLTRQHNHAHLLQQFDRFEEALVIEREVVKRWPTILDAKHPHVASALQSAGIFALAAGEYAEATGYFARLLEHPAMADATPRQRALRPLLHASALVASGPERYDDARRVFAAGLEAAEPFEKESGAFVRLARAAAAQAARADDPTAEAALKRAHQDLSEASGEQHWAARLAARWLAER